MQQRFVFKSLVILNLVLLGCLLVGLRPRAKDNRDHVDSGDAAGSESARQQSYTTRNEPSAEPIAPPTPFAQVYSADPIRFAANLRAIRCPEQTVVDILKAEVHRTFRDQEQALRPTPADHVPFTWSARPAEPRLVERRQAAAALAREQGALLRGALGCEAGVSMPLYAMTTSDLRFESTLASFPQLDACAIRAAHDNYWTEVQALQQRTKGFWLRQDLEELNQLKAEREQALARLTLGNAR